MGTDAAFGFLTAGDQDAARAARAVEKEDAEPLALATRGGVVRRRSRVSTHPGSPRGRGGVAGREIGIAEPLPLIANRAL
jgi:hypothetical protein